MSLMQVDEVCLYNYIVEQQFGNDLKQNITFSAAVEIGCHSGTYKIIFTKSSL
jgi:hypothetical protein